MRPSKVLWLYIAEYQSELDDKYMIGKDAHAALMDAKIAEIKSKFAALQHENPINVAASNWWRDNIWFPHVCIGCYNGRSWQTILVVCGHPCHPLQFIGDKDERVWNVIDFKGAVDTITHGYLRHRTISTSILDEVTSLTGDLLIHFDGV